MKYQQAPNSLPSVFEAKEEVSKPELGPMPMIYDLTVGWVVEKMGPTTKHWKRLARGSKTSKPIKTESPIKLKKEDFTPLIDLDPNALEQKRRRGKSKLGVVLENEQRVGGVEVAVEQPRLAQ